MSNPDLPGSYWQQEESGYPAGRRARSASPDRYQPRDDGQGWRNGSTGRGDQRWSGQGGNGTSGRHSRGSGQPPANGYGNGHAAGNGNGHAAGNGNGNGSRHAGGNGAHSGREAQTWTGMIAGRVRGGQRQSGDSRWREWTDQFSRTADDLKSRIGRRGAGGGRAAQDQTADQLRSRLGMGASGAGRAAQDWPPRSGGYQNGRGNSGTAFQQRDDYWQGGRTGQLTGSRTAIRPGTRVGGGGRGGGHGGGRWDGRYPRGAWDRFKRYLRSGDWWRHWTVKKVLGLLGAGVAGVILLLVGAFFIIYANTKIPTASELTATWQSSVVYFSNGTQLGTFDSNQNGTSVDRQLLTSNQIPKVMTQAMAAAEDRHFYTEGGVSLTALGRAALSDVFGHGSLQGASTITMQYAKNYYNGVNTGQNLSTKFKEIIIAMKLGHEESKTWVMTNYLNTVDFGGTNLGIGAAAENYFNVNLTNPGTTLTVSQAAMLAAMPNSPGFFNPSPTGGAGYTALKARWRYVLTNMVRDGDITQKEMNAQTFPQLTPPPAGNGESGINGYLMSMIKQQLEAPTSVGGYGLTDRQVNTGGYKITTTLNQGLISALTTSMDQEIAAMQATGHPFQSYDRLGAVLEDPKTGGITAVYGGPGYQSGCTNDCWINMAESAQPVGSSFKTYVLSTAVNEGMNVFTSQLNGFSPIWIPDSPANTTTTEDTLSPTSPPPGLTAQSQSGWSPGPNAPGAIYYFKFDEAGENSGKPLPVNVAAAISSDPAFEDLAHRDGIQNVISMAKAFGVGQNAFVQPCSVAASQSPTATQAQIIADCNDMTGSVNGMDVNFGAHSNKDTAGSPAIALGENPLTPVEQATTFATLADDGLYHTPHVIATLQQNGNTLPNHIQSAQVLSPQAAADVDWALSFDNNMSGATAEGSIPFRRGGVIGKTGTLGIGNVASQAWFIGATPNQAALSVALFTNSPGTENLDNLAYVGGTQGSQGGAWPATIWNNFMSTVFGNVAASPLFPTVNGAPFVTWIQVQAKKPGNCNNLQQFLQSQQQVAQGGQPSCTCPNNDPTQCNGNGNGGGRNGGGPSPAPSTTPCTGIFGGGCSPSTGPGGGGGGGGTGAATTATLIGGSTSPGSAGSLGSSRPVLAAEETTSAIRLLVAT